MISAAGSEKLTKGFGPLVPGFVQLPFGNHEALISEIDASTAAILIEPIQGEGGILPVPSHCLKGLRDLCDEHGILLIFDEIQCGIGRTGKLFAFEHFDVVPDLLTLGKALGGGMPIGALVSSSSKLKEFTFNPMLGHITTFGGHPVICAAANASLKVITDEIDFAEVERLGKLLEDLLSDESEILEIRRIGMMYAFDMESFERVEKVVKRCLEKGLISFWFLSHPYSFRLSPPLNIKEAEVRTAAGIIQEAIQETAIH